MGTALTTPMRVDVGHAFGFVFRSRNWVGKLAVAALCLLFFWVFLIPLLILFGYFIETARTISRGEHELPHWTHIGRKLREGFVLAVVLSIWGLPGSILFWSNIPIHCVGSSCSYQPGGLAGVDGIYSLLLGLLTPAIWSQYLEGGFVAAFDFRAVFRRATLQPGMTVMVWLMATVAGIIGVVVGLILIVIGLLFTLPWAWAVTANLYGQFSRLTQSAATAGQPQPVGASTLR